jgi:O-antigen/teichoic acid export membrane protein
MSNVELKPDISAQGSSRRLESIRSRYVVTLSTQLFRLALSIVTAGIVPRALGPAAYGSYNFLMSATSTLRGFLEPSAQQAFFTFSSQDKRSGSLTKLYGAFLLAQILVIFGLIGLAALAGVTGQLWPGQQLDQILWVTLLDWALFFVLSLQQLGDSKGLTIRPQLINTVMALSSTVGLLTLAALGWLNFYTYVWLNLFTALVSFWSLGYWILVLNRDLCWTGELRGRIREHLRRWWRYAAPLILYEYYMPIISYLSIYLVQAWYGSVEQGYFALALRWSALVLVFTSSALMIFWREIAYWTAEGDQERAGRIYLRFNRLLVFLALALAFWLSLSSPTLIPALAGDQYQAAIPVLMIMAFYPVVQTYGQLTSAALKASGRTAAYRNLAIFFSVPDLALTYVLLAPPTAPVPGLNLGAIGVALRMVGYGLLSAQVFDWSNFRFFGLSYSRAVLQRLAAVAVVGGCAVMVMGGLHHVLQAWRLHALLSLALVSGLYFGIVSAAVLVWPGMIGFSRAEILSNFQSLGQKILAFREWGS